MCFDQGTRNGQANATPTTALPRAGSVHAVEAVEDMRAVFRGDPDARIADGNLNFIIDAFCRDRNPTFLRRILQRVACEIGQISGPACDAPTTGTPTVTFTPSPTETLATDITPTPTLVPTEPLPTQPAPPPSSGTIIVTDSDQTLTFTCNGNVVYYSGSPVITNKGNENIITPR